ncbi:MAG TPA: hypothetical protein VGE47_03215, partial [Burkholderiaceae bacterium]
MIKQVKRWFVARANTAHWRDIIDWAEARGALFRQSRDATGFVIDQAKAGVGALRIEWGPSQRSYIEGHELRIRCEAKLHSDLQMMVLCRVLMETLEKAVFEAYTDTLKTRVDTDTPEEMRWLVMFPKLSQFANKQVRTRYGAVGVNKNLLSAWIDGDLGNALADAGTELLREDRPMVMLTMRGNLYLRTSMPDPDLHEIQALLKLVELAAREAQKVGLRLADGTIH